MEVAVDGLLKDQPGTPVAPAGDAGKKPAGDAGKKPVGDAGKDRPATPAKTSR
ncbi:hypothetical protein OWR29_42485 [Actinoplanes sp. Pm04-4]|uniref:Uncharacterized protein n=1 Tax=Paractinoplanes pyxinae TaxID=2997416 RepID=A0ABT4BDW2_9ACTN|nr:hypothetical protein [Actinoplanes pyxinae]MCY1144708.1 hypothetical protein [Actinoplanes pyxinae]